MGIQGVQPKNHSNPYQNYGQKKVLNPSFTGGASSVTRDIIELLPGKNAIKFMDKLKWLKGELGGILITAVGTGLIAPLFIGFNPFVKAPKGASEEEKKEVNNTKLYTAMRQPVSAVLAVIFQLGALKPIDKFLDKVFNEPEYAKNVNLHLDQSVVNNDSYLKTVISEEMKAEVKQGKASYATGKEFDAELAKRIERRQERQLNKVAEGLAETGQIRVGKRVLENKTVAELLNEQIDSYIGRTAELKIDEKGIDFYNKRAAQIMNNEAELKDILDPKKLPSEKAAFETYLREKAANTGSKDVKELLEEIINHDENLRGSRCQRTLERIDKIKDACGGEYTAEKYNQFMRDGNQALDDMAENLSKCKIAEPDKATVETIKETVQKVSETCTYDKSNKVKAKIFANIDTFQTQTEKLSKKIFKDISKGYKNLVGGKYKGFNQLAKIVIGVFVTLPFTCTALNYIYPRFMEICFPKLAGVKKEQPANQAEGGR